MDFWPHTLTHTFTMHKYKRKLNRNSPAVARRWLLIPDFFHPGAGKKRKRDSVSNEDINEGLLQI